MEKRINNEVNPTQISPRSFEIIEMYKNLLTLSESNAGLSSENPVQLIDDQIKRFFDHLNQIHMDLSFQEKNELFTFFIDFYLKIHQNQSLLNINPLEIKLGAVLNRIFITLNFFSKKYVPLFIKKINQLLPSITIQQRTIDKYLSNNPPKILLSPITARVANYINKTGQEFLSGLSQINQASQSLKSSSVMHELLREYILSSQCTNILPDWFKSLSNQTQNAVINDLLLT